MENENYLQERAAHQHVPGLLYEGERIKSAVQKEGGGTSVSSADPYKPNQIHLDLYYGETSPLATEVPHMHMEQTESYTLMEGEAEMLTKWRWEDNGWKRKILHAGDVILIQPEVCHWFRWRSKDGRAVVFKRQIAGVGKPPNGKQTCMNGCPHYKRGCVLPDGFNPEPSPK